MAIWILRRSCGDSRMGFTDLYFSHGCKLIDFRDIYDNIKVA